MLGAAAVKASGFFKNYMVDGWAGQCLSAGKALARAVGIILVELIFILLFDSAALFKVLKTATKSGMKGVLQMAKAGTKSTLKAGKQALVATGKGFVKQAGKAKFAVQSVGKGIAKGVKSLDELGQRLAKKFKFKGFRFRIRGKRWEILGEVNPLFVIMSGPVPDEDLFTIIKKDKADVPKGLKKGDEFIDKQGRGLMKISDLDEFTRTPNYREIFALANKRGISDDVIHHLIEKGSDFAYLFEKELINAPKSLRAIPKGNINDVLHLSDIRRAWDDIYKLSNQLLKEGGTTADVKSIIIQFAGKTDEFISKSLSKIAQKESIFGTLSKDQISSITNEFKYLLK